MAWETTPGPHGKVKPEKIAAVAAAALESNLVVPATFRREGIEQFKGAKGDAINVKVEGVLPFRTYGWRNNRSTAIQFDTYKERTVQVTFGDDIYSAVALTDEQSNMDFSGWELLVSKQTEAIGRGLEYKACDFLEDAPYEVQVQLDEADLRGSLVALRSVMNKLKVVGPRTILCETDLEAALLNDDKLNLASNVGEAEAVSALREATIGRRYGFDFVVADELSGMSVAMVPSAFIFATGAPSVPQSVAWGATGSVNGVAVRLIRDYDADHTTDRSLVNAYQSFREVSDPLVARDDSTGQAFVTDANHFVRAVKVTVGSGYTLELANTELEKVTGLTSTDGTSDGA